MAKRYYLSKVVPDGGTGFGYHAALLDAVAAAGLGHRATYVMPPGDASGAPLLPVCLCVLAVSDHSGLAGAADFDQFPGVSLDTTIASIPAATRNAIANRITARGLTVPNLAGTDTLRTLVRAVGRQVRDDFDESANDTPDVT